MLVVAGVGRATGSGCTPALAGVESGLERSENVTLRFGFEVSGLRTLVEVVEMEVVNDSKE